MSNFPEMVKIPGNEEFTSSNVDGVWASSDYAYQGIFLRVMETVDEQEPEWQPIVGWWFSHTTGGYKDRTPISRENRGTCWFYLEGVHDEGGAQFNIYRRDAAQAGITKTGEGRMRLDRTSDGLRITFRFYTEEYGRDHFILEQVGKLVENDPDNCLLDLGNNEGVVGGRFVTPQGDNFTYYYFNVEQDRDEYYPCWYMLSGVDLGELASYSLYSKYKDFYWMREEYPHRPIEPNEVYSSIEMRDDKYGIFNHQGTDIEYTRVF